MQMLQTVPREEHKELLIRLKNEQNRKVAALADLYEDTINKMVAEQTVCLLLHHSNVHRLNAVILDKT